MLKLEEARTAVTCCHDRWERKAWRAARLLAARDAAAGVVTGDELPTVQSLAVAVTT
ncbi:MAG TPA: hypothetical protein VFI59_03445 [Actinomycetota bacterium]|nr:hypothetical protein [Actinomycetota bacterium]